MHESVRESTVQNKYLLFVAPIRTVLKSFSAHV